jgi:hypothetical protein
MEVKNSSVLNAELEYYLRNTRKHHLVTVFRNWKDGKSPTSVMIRYLWNLLIETMASNGYLKAGQPNSSSKCLMQYNEKCYKELQSKHTIHICM